MVNIRRTVASALVACAGLAFGADPVTWEWSQSAAGTQTYKTDANWKGGTAPTNYGGGSTFPTTTDTFVFTNEVGALQLINILDGNSHWYGFEFGSLVMDRFHQLCIPYGNRVFIRDASQMESFIRLPGGTQHDSGAAGGPILYVSGGNTNCLAQTSIQNFAWLLRASDNSTGGVAEFGKLFGLGLFSIGGENTGVYQLNNKTPSYLFDSFQTGVQGHLKADGSGATATVRGHATTAAIAEGAYLHLDASAAGTVDADFTWHDADGGAVVATPVGTPTMGTSTNNLATLLLGSGTAYELSEDIDGVREIFLVFRDFDAGYGTRLPPLVGDYTGVGNFARSGNTTYGHLFATGTAATKWMDAGEVWCDGTRVPPDHCIGHTGPGQLHVVSVMLHGGTGLVGCLGETAKGASSSGGKVEFAEVLVYKRTLTDAERRATNKFLREKWQSADFAYDWDLGSYWVADSGNNSDKVVFEAGTTAVREVKLPSAQTSFTKYGEGRLETSRIAPENVSLTVNAGTLAIVRPEEPVKCEMAADPVAWFDPSDSTTLTYDAGSETRINKMIDVRKKENKKGQIPNAHTVQNWGVDGISPLCVTDTPTGLRALDFGDAATSAATFEGKSSCMKIDGYPYGNEAFVVWKKNADSCGVPFGNGSWEFFGCNANRIIDRSYCRGSAIGGYWTVNGEIVSCSNVSLPTGEYMVVAVRIPEGFSPNMLGPQRLSADVNGACSFGEMILYDRILTPEERRDTEAYLMKKWLGKDHPMAKSMTVPTYTIAAGAENTIETDVDMTIGTLAAANGGTFTKKGKGRLATDLPAATTAVAVEGGELAASEDLAVLFQDADVHFDASDDSSFTYVSGSDSEIAKWNDARLASGGSTLSVRLETDMTPHAPKRIETTINGVSRTVVDFGEYCLADKDAGNVSTNFGSRLRLYEGDSAKTLYYGREFYIVRRDTEADKAKRVAILAAGPYQIDRNQDQAFSNMTFPPRDSGDYTYTLDGANVPYNTSIDTDWHVHCLTTPNNNFWIRNLGGDEATSGKNYFGGIQIAEVVSFQTPRSAAERQAIIDYLREKWMGETDGAKKTYASVSVAEGASLDLTMSGGWTGVAATKLSGGGSVDFGVPVTGLAEISGAIGADGSAQTTTVAGAVTLASEGVVKVTCPVARPKTGFYPLLAATSITNPEVLGNWTLQCPQTVEKPTAIEVRGGQVGLLVRASGLIIIAR